MYTRREKFTLAFSAFASALALVTALAASCGWLASGGDRYSMFGFSSYPGRGASPVPNTSNVGIFSLDSSVRGVPGGMKAQTKGR